MRLGRIAGIGLVLAGVVINKWTLEAFVVADGVVETMPLRVAIALAELVLVATGVGIYAAAPRLRRPSRAQLALLIVSTIVSIGLVEVFLRIRPFEDSDATNLHERRAKSNFEAIGLGWRMIPSRSFEMAVEDRTNTYTANAQGFRSPHDFSQPAARRVALVGDSFTWGWGVEYPETFAALLEQRLAGTEVDDFGMPGFGIDQMWQSVRQQALPLGPALIVVGFIDDDFSRSLFPIRPEEGFPKPRFELRSGQLVPQPPGGHQSLLQHSVLWRLIDHVFMRVRPFGEWWVLNTALFDAIGRDCAAAGVPVLFVRLPQIDGGAFPSLARHFEREGLAYLDLGQTPASEDFHYKEDRHLNARGHARVAQAIADWIGSYQAGKVRAN